MSEFLLHLSLFSWKFIESLSVFFGQIIDAVFSHFTQKLVDFLLSWNFLRIEFIVDRVISFCIGGNFLLDLFPEEIGENYQNSEYDEDGIQI